MKSCALAAGCMARCERCRSRNSRLSPPRRCTPPRRTRTVNASSAAAAAVAAAAAAAPWRAPWTQSAARRTAACPRWTGW